MKKIKYFASITIISTLVLIGLIVSASLFSTILSLIKQGGTSIIASMLIMVVFIMSVGVSAILGLVDIPLTIKSIKHSERKFYPLICLIIAVIAVIIAIIFIVMAIINRAK